MSDALVTHKLTTLYNNKEKCNLNVLKQWYTKWSKKKKKLDSYPSELVQQNKRQEITLVSDLTRHLKGVPNMYHDTDDYPQTM